MKMNAEQAKTKDGKKEMRNEGIKKKEKKSRDYQQKKKIKSKDKMEINK